MNDDDLKVWRNTNLLLDLAGKGFRLARRHWVVSVPLLTWLLVGLLLGDGILGLVIWALVTYIVVKRWRELRGKSRVAYAQAVEEYGSQETYDRVTVYRTTWPEVARHAGLCQRKETFGVGTWQASREAKRQLSPMARVDAMRKGSPLDDLDVPELLDLRPSPLGVTLSVRMLPGQEVAAYERAAEALGHQWGVEQVRVALARPGAVELTPVTSDPLGGVIEITAQTVPVMESLKAVQVGRQEDGTPWMLPVDQSHGVAAGVPGSGKSVFANVMLAGLSSRPDVQIIGIDPAGGVEFSDWAPRMSALATDQDSAIDALTRVWEQVHEPRIRWLRENGFKSLANAGYSEAMPLYVVVIDEAAQLFRMDSPIKEDVTRGKRLIDLVTRLVTVSRKTGIVVWLMTQKPLTSVIPSLVRDNAQVKVAFRVMTPEAATTVLGDAASVAPMSPTEIRLDQKGVAVAATESGELKVVRSFYINEESGREIARRYASLARPLPRQTDEDIIDAEVIA